MKEPSIKHDIPVDPDKEKDYQKIYEEPVEEDCLNWDSYGYGRKINDVYFPYNLGCYNGD